MWPDVPTLSWLETISPVAFPVVPLSKEVVDERKDLTCSSGDTQEPAGIFQHSPEHLELHGTRGVSGLPEGQAAKIPLDPRCSGCL